MSHPGRLRVILTMLLVGLGGMSAASSLSSASFTAQRTNPQNAFAAAPAFDFRVATGTYTGNNADSRSIAGLGFAPDLVVVKGNNNQTAVARSAEMTGDQAKPLAGATALSANMIQALAGDGFQVGTNARVNSNGVAYSWVAFAAPAGTMSVGAYVGNGAASRSVTGLGFAPEYVIAMPANSGRAVMRAASMSTSFQFDSATGTANQINALAADGFTAGSGLNANGVTYHYVAFNETAGLVSESSYTGNAVGGRSIAGVGFRPDYAIVRSSSTGTARAGVQRPRSLTGTSSSRFNGAANDTAAITALQPDGIQIGTSNDVNANANPYSLIAFKDQGS